MLPIEMSIRSSQLITFTVGGLGLVLAVGVWFVPAPDWFKGSLSALILLESYRQVMEHGLRVKAHSIVHCRWGDVFEWSFKCQNGEDVKAKDVKVEWVSRWMIALSVEGRWNWRKKIWIPLDGVDEGSFRQLSVGLACLEQARSES